VANALRALATLTAIITRLPLLKIEIINHLQHTLLSNALTPFAFQQYIKKIAKQYNLLEGIFPNILLFNIKLLKNIRNTVKVKVKEY